MDKSSFIYVYLLLHKQLTVLLSKTNIFFCLHAKIVSTSTFADHLDLWWIVSHSVPLCESCTYQTTCLSLDWNYFGGLQSLNPFLHHKNEGSVEEAATVKWQRELPGHCPQYFQKLCHCQRIFKLWDCQTAINASDGRWSIILTSFK